MKKTIFALLLLIMSSQLVNAANNALSFNGTTSYVSLPATLWSNNFSNGSAITVEYWYKKGDGSTTYNMNSVYRVQPGGSYFVAGYYGSGGSHLTSTGLSVSAGNTTTINDGTWHHMAITWSKNGYFTSYFDGVQFAQIAGGSSNLPAMDGINYLASYNGSSEFLNGSLDDVRIWNTTRTAAQIAANKDVELVGNESGLVAYYKMSNGSGTTLTDNTNHGYDGSLSSGVSWSAGASVSAITTPTSQASGIVFSNVTSTQMTIGWTIGNGTNRAVFMKSANSGAASPANETTYTANSAFCSGTQIGSTGWYCVYNGSGTNTTVTNIVSTNPYNVMVVEYNGTAGSENYLTTSVATNPTPLSSIYNPKNCLSFNGTSSYMEVPNAAAFQPTGGEFTAEAWINIDASYTSTGTVFFNIPTWIAKGYEFTTSYDATTGLNVFNGHMLINGLEYWLGTAPCMKPGTWNHIAVTWSNTSQKVILYVNGSNKAEQTIPTRTYVTSGYGPEIGRAYRRGLGGSPWNFFKGKMDEIRFWNVARTPDQVRSTLGKTLRGNETGLVSYYKLDETSGTSAADNIAANAGTCSNTSIVASTAFNTWINTGSTDWATATNWSLGTVPVSTDNVAIYHAVSSSLPTTIGATNLGCFLLDNTVTMSLPSDLTLTGDLVLESNLDMNGKSINLGPSGNLAECAGNLSGATGNITATRSINNITAVNVAGLGATLTTSANMGITTISRTHSQAGGTLSSSILRKYLISPTTNTGLNATFVFNYLDNELNGLTEGGLQLVKSTDSGATWSLQGGTINTTANTATLSGISSFGTLTLASSLAPTLSTQAVSSISTSTATGNGNITNLGFPNPTAYGVCWNTTGTPTIVDSKVTNGAASATGAFTACIAGLSAGTLYYVRAYATNIAGTSYGSQVNFLYSTADITSSQIADPPNADIVVNTGTTFNCNGDNQNYHSITVQPGGKLTLADTKTLNAGTLVLESSTSGTATFNDGNTGETPPAVTATVKQYLTSGRNWYVATPLSNATTSALSTAGSILYYNEPTAEWLEPLAGSTLNPLRGYISASTSTTGTISFTGTLNTGAKSITLTRTTGKAKDGFNLVGNPYPSYVSWDDATKTNLENTIWYRTQNGLNTYVFDTYGSISGIGTNNNGTAAVTGTIPPMQSFWVRVAAGNAIGTLAFNNSMRSHGSSGNRLKAPSASEVTAAKYIRLQVSNGVNSDEAILLFNPLASDNLDAYDSPKMSNGDAAIPEIYTLAGTERVVINGLTETSYNSAIPLGFTSYKNGTNSFTISCSEISNFLPTTQLYLRDYQTGSITPLTIGANYQFTSDKYDDTKRFDIISNTSISTNIEDKYANQQIHVNIKNGTILHLKTSDSEKSIESFKITDIQGNVLYFNIIKKSEFEVNTNLPSGLYLVISKTSESTYINKIIIN